MGFEPTIRLSRIHAFQACSIGHSDTPPNEEGEDSQNSLKRQHPFPLHKTLWKNIFYVPIKLIITYESSFETPFYFLALVFILNSCSDKKPLKEEKPTVVTSVAPYKYFIDKISGGHVEAVVLVPSNANPHIFEPGLRSIEKAKRAKLWLRIGENFEEKIASSLDMKSIDLTEGITLIRDQAPCGHAHHSSYDLHLWLSPKNGLKQVDIIEAALTEAFPELASVFHTQAEAFREELKNLDQEIAETLQSAPYKTLMVSHPAFAYFCRDYGLSQLSIEEEGKEPSLKYITTLSIPQEGTLPCILIQAQHNNKGALRLSETLKIPTALVDPYSEDYTSSLRQLAQTIKNAGG